MDEQDEQDEQYEVEIELILMSEFYPWAPIERDAHEITEAQDAFLKEREGWYWGENDRPTMSWFGVQPMSL